MMMFMDTTQSGDVQSGSTAVPSLSEERTPAKSESSLRRRQSVKTLCTTLAATATQVSSHNGLPAASSSAISASLTRNPTDWRHHSSSSCSNASTSSLSRLPSQLDRGRLSSSSPVARDAAPISTWSTCTQSTPPRFDYVSYSNRSSSDGSVDSVTCSESRSRSSSSSQSTVEGQAPDATSCRQPSISRSASTSTSGVCSSRLFSVSSLAALSLSPSSTESLASSETSSPASSFQPCTSACIFPSPHAMQTQEWRSSRPVLPNRVDSSSAAGKRSTTPPYSPPNPIAATLEYSDFDEDASEDQISDETNILDITSQNDHPPSLETVAEVEEEPTLAYAYIDGTSGHAPSFAELESSFVDFMHDSSCVLPHAISYDMLKGHNEASTNATIRSRGYSSPAVSRMPAPFIAMGHVEHFGQAISPTSSPAVVPHSYGRQSITPAARGVRHTRRPTGLASFHVPLHPRATFAAAAAADADENEEIVTCYAPISTNSTTNASRSTLNVSVTSRFTTNGLKSAFEADDTSTYIIDAAVAENKRARRLSKKPSLWFASLRDTIVPLKPKLSPVAVGTVPGGLFQHKIISTPSNARHVSSGAVIGPHVRIRESPFGRGVDENVPGYISLLYEASLFAKDISMSPINGSPPIMSGKGDTQSGELPVNQSQNHEQSSHHQQITSLGKHTARRVLHKRSISSFSLRSIPTLGFDSQHATGVRSDTERAGRLKRRSSLKAQFGGLFTVSR